MITVGLDIDIVQIVEENAIDMAQDGLLMEEKCLQVTRSQKGLLLTMLLKNIDLHYV